MAKNFASIAFSPASKALQEKLGSRKAYARLERDSYVDGLTENEIEFIAGRDSFYMATMAENGYPYIQHRGGPKGFLKVLNDKQLGFVDFSGNRQYVTVGNLTTNDKIALIMVDYPTRSRVKIYAKARVVELSNEPELFATLNLEDYKAKPERMMVLDIEVYDWNCPQHITPRYTLEEIEQAISPQRQYIAQLEEEIKTLKAAAGEI